MSPCGSSCLGMCAEGGIDVPLSRTGPKQPVKSACAPVAGNEKVCGEALELRSPVLNVHSRCVVAGSGVCSVVGSAGRTSFSGVREVVHESEYVRAAQQPRHRERRRARRAEKSVLELEAVGQRRWSKGERAGRWICMQGTASGTHASREIETGSGGGALPGSVQRRNQAGRCRVWHPAGVKRWWCGACGNVYGKCGGS